MVCVNCKVSIFKFFHQGIRNVRYSTVQYCTYIAVFFFDVLEENEARAVLLSSWSSLAFCTATAVEWILLRTMLAHCRQHNWKQSTDVDRVFKDK
jgi:hypothetical protein